LFLPVIFIPTEALKSVPVSFIFTPFEFINISESKLLEKPIDTSESGILELIFFIILPPSGIKDSRSSFSMFLSYELTEKLGFEIFEKLNFAFSPNLELSSA